MKTFNFIKKVLLSLIVIIGASSICYLFCAFIILAGIIENGGSSPVIEQMKDPYFSSILFGSIIWMYFLKKTRKRLEKINSKLGEKFFL